MKIDLKTLDRINTTPPIKTKVKEVKKSADLVPIWLEMLFLFNLVVFFAWIFGKARIKIHYLRKVQIRIWIQGVKSVDLYPRA